MKNIFDLVLNKINEFNTPCCIGLDPDLNYIPTQIKKKSLEQYGNTTQGAANALFEFNKKIIEATEDIVGIYKLQIAFYEQYGSYGMQAFIDTTKYLKSKNKIVIGDIKRNDIGNTAKAYADAYIGKVKLFDSEESIYNTDIVTINGYLGEDSIKPFIETANKYTKGLFILSKTSNKSSSEFQDAYASCNNTPLKNYLLMMKFINKWGKGTEGNAGYKIAGAVFGLTFSEEIKKVREKYKECFFLVPGYGSQGGEAKDTAHFFNKNGEGAIITSSRQVIYAYKNSKKYTEDNFQDAAREETLKMKKLICEII